MEWEVATLWQLRGLRRLYVVSVAVIVMYIDPITATR